MSLERILTVGLSHSVEEIVQFLVGVGTFSIRLNPINESIFSIKVLSNSETFENGVKSLLSIRLNNILLVHHQVVDPLQDFKVLEPSAH